MTHNFKATVFVYRNRYTKEIRAEYIDGAMAMTSEWEHLETVEPRLWIQAHWDDAAREREACIKALEDNEQFYCRDTLLEKGNRMTDIQPNALRLADALNDSSLTVHHKAAAELRRLYTENEDRKNACDIYSDALKKEKALNAQLLEALTELSSYVTLAPYEVQRKAIDAIVAAKEQA